MDKPKPTPPVIGKLGSYLSHFANPTAPAPAPAPERVGYDEQITVADFHEAPASIN